MIERCKDVHLLFFFQQNHERQPIAEMQEAEESGEFLYVHKVVKDEEEIAGEEGPVSPPPSPEISEVWQIILSHFVTLWFYD